MARILIAEDDHSLRGFLALALERAGHEVTARPDGFAALETLKADHKYDMLLTDVVMPGLDGIALAQQARALNPALKVMFITGFAAMTLEADLDSPVIAKPFHLKDLVAQVEKTLGLPA